MRYFMHTTVNLVERLNIVRFILRHRVYCFHELYLSHTKKIVLKFTELSAWPQQPKLEPGCIRCMGALQQRVYRIAIFNLDDLKDRERIY